MIEPHKRDHRIDELLQKYHKSRKNRVIVFVLYKKEASRVEAQLGKKGWKVRVQSFNHKKATLVIRFVRVNFGQVLSFFPDLSITN